MFDLKNTPLDLGHLVGVEHGEREVAVASFFKHPGRGDPAGEFLRAADENLAVGGVVELVVGDVHILELQQVAELSTLLL